MEFENPNGGLNGLLGIEFVEVTADHTVAKVAIDERHLQPYGIVHGGLYTALIEVAASMPAAVWAAERGMPGAVGVNNSTDFVRAIREGVLVATATPIHRGRTQQLWEVAVTDEAEGKLRARGRVRMQNITNPDTVGSNSPGGTN